VHRRERGATRPQHPGGVEEASPAGPRGQIRKGVPPSVRKLPALFVAVLFAASVATTPARSSIILSELCDPQSNYTTDRFIEIFNTGPDAVDLTGWSVVAVANSADGTTWALSGTIAAGQAKVLGYTTPVTAFTVHFPNAAWNAINSSGGAYNWNGKIGDGAKLKNASGTVIDVVVATGDLFNDKDYVRNASVTSPNSVYTPAEWTATAVTLATNASPGTHNGSQITASGPRISNVVTDPTVPVVASGVAVQASVVDTSGAIASVTLSWGTTSSSLPNPIAMTLLSDSTYRTSALIPAQSAGATVYYQVQAVGAAATSTTSVLSYTLSGGGGGAPTVLWVGEMSDSTLLVQFSEPVEETSAESPANYTVGALSGVDAVRDPLQTDQVLVTVRSIPAGTRTLAVNGVADLSANVAYGATCTFNYVDVSIPAGYYASAAGLKGSALRVALHNIIKNHTVKSYAYALTAFATTDVKPNGKIWDMYSDVPGGTPPYEYAVGETGQGASEGLGYNREHSWPQSWFNGVSPPYSDLWVLYPTDSYVNGHRSNYAFGEVGTATYTSLNGSKLGPSVSAGFSGTVFEPIDAFKGDFARGTFYVSTRYFNEDAGWSSSDCATHAELLSWAVDQYSAWSTSDPVSWKERLRNGAIYVIQNNRNPFVDHPEFIAMIYDSNSVVGVGDGVSAVSIRLRQNLPNPFGARTTIGFDLARREPVSLRVFDVTGRLVRTLADGSVLEAGSHHLEWNGCDEGGAKLGSGLYFCRLVAGPTSVTRRMVLAR
jgi:endonuclease I